MKDLRKPNDLVTLSSIGPSCLGGEEMAAVRLSDALADLRAELQQAVAAGEDEELRFELGSVVLELEVTLSTSAGANARAGLWSVVTAGVSADHSRGSVHLCVPKTPSTSCDQVIFVD